jgi:hypothetical protein
MAIAFVGNTPLDFGMDPASFDTATAAGRDTAYSPNSVIIDGANGVGPALNLPGLSGDFWCRFRYRTPGTLFASTSTAILFQALDSNGAEICRINKTSNANNFFVTVYGTSTVVSAASLGLVASTNYVIDIKVVVGANITVELYNNSTLVTSATVTNSVVAKLDPQIVRVWPFNNIGSGSSFLSEMLITTAESTLGLRVATRTPAAAATYTAWDGTVASLSDTDTGSGMSADVNGERESFSLSAYGGAGSPTSIRAVVAKSHGRNQGGTPEKVAHFVRIGGTDYDGTPISVAPFKSVQEVWDVNPATGVAWVVGGITGLEVGLKAVT